MNLETIVLATRLLSANPVGTGLAEPTVGKIDLIDAERVGHVMEMPVDIGHRGVGVLAEPQRSALVVGRPDAVLVTADELQVAVVVDSAASGGLLTSAATNAKRPSSAPLARPHPRRVR